MSFKVAGMYIFLYLDNRNIDVDGSLVDISLAAFGRKEIEIAEVCLVFIRHNLFLCP